MTEARYSKEQWATFNNNMLFAAQLGFRIGHNNFYVGRYSNKGKNVYNEPIGYFKYDNIDFVDTARYTKKGKKYYAAPTNKMMKSHFGHEPEFDTPRTPLKNKNIKHGNVISSIGHPDMHAFDFDNHSNQAELNILIESFYNELKNNPDLLIGTKPDFYGMHVFCLSKDKYTLEKYKEIFETMGGHVDVFNSSRHTAIGIPGFDHYTYNEKDVNHFISLLNVEITGHRLSQHVTHNAQPIIYPTCATFLAQAKTNNSQKQMEEYKKAEEVKKLEYAKAKIRTKSWKLGNAQISLTTKTSKIAADQYIQQLSESKDNNRTTILKSSKGHTEMMRALSALKINDIETFMLKYPEFETNHYDLIDQMICYAKNHKKNTRKYLKNGNKYQEMVSNIRAMVNNIPEIKKHPNKETFASIATYLIFCMKLEIDQPGYVHYLNFCRFNNLPEVAEKTYYRHYNKCIDIRLFGLRRDYYKIGKYCRTIFKGTLYLIEEFRQKVKATSRELVIFNQKGSGCLSFFHIILCTVKQGLKEEIGRYEKLPNFDLQSLLMRISV